MTSNVHELTERKPRCWVTDKDLINYGAGQALVGHTRNDVLEYVAVAMSTKLFLETNYLLSDLTQNCGFKRTRRCLV